LPIQSHQMNESGPLANNGRTNESGPFNADRR